MVGVIWTISVDIKTSLLQTQQWTIASNHKDASLMKGMIFMREMLTTDLHSFILSVASFMLNTD